MTKRFYFFKFSQLFWRDYVRSSLNIARSTTDPEIDSVTWIKLGNNMAPLALVANYLATIVMYLAMFSMYKRQGLFYHQLAPIELVANLTTRWRLLPFASRTFCNHMIIHCLQFWPPGGATCTDCKFGHQKEPLASVANWATIICIGSKFGHEVSPLALVPKLATRLSHMHCHIAL